VTETGIAALPFYGFISLTGAKFVDFEAVAAGNRAVRCRDGKGFPHFAAFAAIAGHEWYVRRNLVLKIDHVYGLRSARPEQSPMPETGFLRQGLQPCVSAGICYVGRLKL
jgi:hypothetical protein